MDLRRAVTAEFHILKRYCTAVMYSVSRHFMELERLGVATQGTPGSTCHQPDGFHGADNGWMDNTLVGGSGK